MSPTGEKGRNSLSRPLRFLFLFSDTGGGHRAGAKAVKGEMERLYGNRAQVEMVDFFVELGRWPFNRFPRWYPAMLSLNGIPWGVGYRLSDRLPLVKTMSTLVWPYAGPATCHMLRRYAPDVIVSFHGVPNCVLLRARRRMKTGAPLAIVTLDLVTVHAGWFVPGASLYMVPTEQAKARALQWGVRRDRVVVTGMPARRSFTEAMHMSAVEARKSLGLDPDRPVVLTVGGGEGMGPLAEVVTETAALSPDAQLVVITGRNRALYDTLSALKTPVSLRVEGFVNNMEVWMRAADILVTKAGPNTLAEAFIAGLPLVLYAALPGQEEGNVTHVVENGAGVWAPQPESAARAVIELLDDPVYRARMAMRSATLAHPHAAEEITRQLWSLGMHANLTFAMSLSSHSREHPFSTST